MSQEANDDKTFPHIDVKRSSDIEHTPELEDAATEFEEMRKLRTGLHQRHIQMIALASTIGTGLFLGSGKANAAGGPLGALLGYTLIGILVTAPVLAIAEMSALVPLSGGVIRHAEYFFDPAMSFSIGWNQIYGYMCSLPAEITNAIRLTPIISMILMVAKKNSSSPPKIAIQTALFTDVVQKSIITAAALVSGGGPGGHAYGFQFWRNPGPLVQYLDIGGSLGRFLGFYTTFTNAVYAYNGVEQISLAAAETKNPRRNIPRAAKRIFWRVLIFYVISIFFVGMLVPSDDPHLFKSTGNAAQSPFVIAAQRAGIHVVPSIINAVVLTSAWSAGNSGLLGASRTLFGLAREGRAPKVFTRISRFGIPYVSVIFMALFVALGFMTLSHTAATVFGWLQSLVAVASLVYWTMICIVYLRFYAAFKEQGVSRDRLPWKSPAQPYLSWMGVVWCTILLLTSGWSTFLNHAWDTETFISSYINIPIFLLLYFGFKFAKKTRLVPLDQSPILKFIEIAEQHPEPPPKPKNGLHKINILWS